MADKTPAELRAAALARGHANAAANGHTDADPSELTPTRRPLEFQTLAAQVRDGVPPAKLICGDLLYAAGMHSLAGPPDTGKTFIAWYWALMLLRAGGKVMVFDEESGAEQTAEKLIAMDAQPTELANLAYCPNPGRAWSDPDLVDLGDAMTTHRPDLVIWDSASEFLSIAGLDEDRAAEVTRFTSRVLKPCARRFGAAVLIIDHDSKAKGASRYARGSSAKLAGIDVAFKLAAIKPFSRDTDGILKLTVTKDRRGWLHRDHRVTIAHATPVHPLTIELTAETATAAGDLTAAQAGVLAALADTPAPIALIIDRFKDKQGHGLTRETASRALKVLAERGMADRFDQGRGRPALWGKLMAPPADDDPPPPDEPW